MGGLRKYMPITWITALIGTLALIGFPGFAGFFSKDSIIEAVHLAHEHGRDGAALAYWALLLGVFVTALYSFRLYFLVFHGEPRMDEHTRSHLHESPAVVTIPLIALAVPSVLAGALGVGPMVFGHFFDGAIYVAGEGGHHGDAAHGAWAMFTHGLVALPTWLALAGAATAWYLYMAKPDIPARIAERFAGVHAILMNKYGLDDFNQKYIAGGARAVGDLLWRFGDVAVIDGALVNGSARLVGWISGLVRHIQSGYLYHYAFAMILGLVGLFGFLFTRFGLAL